MSKIECLSEKNKHELDSRIVFKEKGHKYFSYRAAPFNTKIRRIRSETIYSVR